MSRKRTLYSIQLKTKFLSLPPSGALANTPYEPLINPSFRTPFISIQSLRAYREKMPRYIEAISQLEPSYFYKKERPNAQDKKVKIREKLLLLEVMMKGYEKRLGELEDNYWFDSLYVLYLIDTRR